MITNKNTIYSYPIPHIMITPYVKGQLRTKDLQMVRTNKSHSINL